MGIRLERRKGLGFRVHLSKPKLVKFLQKRPTAVYEFRYEREDGMHRTITCPVGWGRAKRGKYDDALELAERRLDEQFGAKSIDAARKIDNVALVEERPDLHQDNYTLVSVREI